MVERYDIDVDGCDCCEVVEYVDPDGEWVKCDDYAKLADLCGRMAVLLGDLTINLNALDARMAKEIVAEAEEVLK